MEMMFFIKVLQVMKGLIQYNKAFTGFNNSSSNVAVSVEEFESLDIIFMIHTYTVYCYRLNNTVGVAVELLLLLWIIYYQLYQEFGHYHRGLFYIWSNN
jgi:hypothetical protein